MKENEREGGWGGKEAGGKGEAHVEKSEKLINEMMTQIRTNGKVKRFAQIELIRDDLACWEKKKKN